MSVLGTLLLTIGLFIQGRWANIPSVSRAALSDTVSHPSLTFILPLSFCILSFPWLFMLRTFPENLEVLQNFRDGAPTFYLAIVIAPLIFLLCSIIAYFYTCKRFYDKRDKELLYQNQKENPRIRKILNATGLKRVMLHIKYEPFFISHELKATKKLISKKIVGWAGGLLYEYGFHSVFYFLDESKIFVTENYISQSSLFIYFLAGSLFRPIFISTNRFGILLGIGISIAGLLFQYSPLNPAIWQGLIGFGSGLFLSCFYLHYLTDQKIHTRGKIVGAADSMQTFGEILATSSFVLFSFAISQVNIKTLQSNIRLFSLFVFLASLVCFIYSFKKELAKDEVSNG